MLSSRDDNTKIARMQNLNDADLCAASTFDSTAAFVFAERHRNSLEDHLMDRFDYRIDVEAIVNWALAATMREVSAAAGSTRAIRDVRGHLYRLADRQALAESLALGSDYLDLKSLSPDPFTIESRQDSSFRKMSGEDCVRLQTIGGVFYPQASPLP